MLTKYRPNICALELHVTYRCNIACNNCTNLIPQAPATMDLSPEEIGAMLNESVACGHKWALITIHGGEPTLHPQIEEICRVLIDYRNTHNKYCTLWMLTNYSTPKIKEIADKINAMGTPLGKSEKSAGNRDHAGSKMDYITVNESPVDTGAEREIGCFQTTECGIAYNRIGFFECSPAASAARVFGYDPVAKHPGEITQEKMDAALCTHCPHCGLSSVVKKRTDKQVTTATWKKALDKYTQLYPKGRAE